MVDLKRDTSNFLQKNLCTYYLPFLKKLFIEFDVFWKSLEPTSSFLGADLDPNGQVYVRGISVEHSHEIVPIKPIFYKRYVDDTYVRKKKNDVDKLFEELNSHNENIKVTLDVNPTKFLDTELVREIGEIRMQVFSKPTKLPVHW